MAALAILSLAAWTGIVVWPTPAPPVAGIVSELPSPPAVAAPASMQAGPVQATSPRPATDLPAPRPHSPPAGSRQAVDEQALAELNTQLSTLLAILTMPRGNENGLTEPPLEMVDLGKGGGPDNEWTERPDGNDMPEHAPAPVVHVSVRAARGQEERVDLGGVRQVEEALGHALRCQDWPAFDQEYQRLALLKPHAWDTLARWRAARAMAMSDYPEAQRILEGLRHANPHDLTTNFNLALVYEAQGRIASAREAAAELARTHPLEPRVQTLLDRLENRPRR